MLHKLLAKDSARLLVEIEKRFFSLWIWGFLEMTSNRGHVLEIWSPMADPGRQPIDPFFRLKVLLKT